MYNLKSKKAIKIENVTLSSLGILESDIEEVLRTNIDMVCDEEESLLIIGRQVKNEKNGRSDLTAIDNNGSLVLIEIKRDKKDIEGRGEAFEFQAIRYAASYATIKNVEELVKIVYAPYIEKYKQEFNLGELTSYELGLRNILEFLEINNSLDKFNENQRIILVASDFDDQTLSAVAWLNKNNVEISCCKLKPFKIDSEIYLDVVKVLPIAKHEDFYVNLLSKSETSRGFKKDIVRRSLPKIDAMLSWGVVKAGDIIQAKGRDEESILLKNGNVRVDEQEMSLQVWLKKIYGWSSVETYGFSIHKKSNKTLSQIRKEFMLGLEKEMNY